MPFPCYVRCVEQYCATRAQKDAARIARAAGRPLTRATIEIAYFGLFVF